MKVGTFMYIADNIVYIGVDDTTIDLFESQYKVPYGVSYNSYVIMDEKIAVMDTVDSRKTEKWLNNLSTVLGNKRPDYLIVSHLEPDHAGNIKVLCDMYPDMKLVGNAKTFQMLPQFFDLDLSNRTVVVKETDELVLGKHILQFFMAPMVHWPEVMVSYEKTTKTLFSADGFGTFGALVQNREWIEEARRYYINIIGKYGPSTLALLGKAATLDIARICPLHGPVLNEDLGYYIDKYKTWASYEAEEDGVVVAFASIHGNTGKAAKKFAEMLKKDGQKHVKVFDLSRDDISVAVEKAFQYSKLVLACATYDGGLFPVMEDFINHLKAKSYQKRTVGFIENGSWAPFAAKKMSEAFAAFKNITICENVVSIKSTMNADNIIQMENLSKELS